MTVTYSNDEIFLWQNRSISLIAFSKLLVPGLVLSSIPFLLRLKTEDTWNRILSIGGPIIIIMSFAMLAEMIFLSRTSYYFRKAVIFMSYRKKDRSIREELEVDAINIKDFEILPTLKNPKLSYLKVHVKTISSSQPSENKIQLFNYLKIEEMKGFEEKLETYFDQNYYHTKD